MVSLIRSLPYESRLKALGLITQFKRRQRGILVQDNFKNMYTFSSIAHQI